MFYWISVKWNFINFSIYILYDLILSNKFYHWTKFIDRKWKLFIDLQSAPTFLVTQAILFLRSMSKRNGSDQGFRDGDGQRTDSDAGRSKFFQSGRKRTADGALSSASRTNSDVGREKFLKSGRRRTPDEGGPSPSREPWPRLWMMNNLTNMHIKSSPAHIRLERKMTSIIWQKDFSVIVSFSCGQISSFDSRFDGTWILNEKQFRSKI